MESRSEIQRYKREDEKEELYNEEKRSGYEKDRQQTGAQNVEDYYSGTDIEKMEEIARQVPLSRLERPKWDLDTMKKTGFLDVFCDENVWKEEAINTETIMVHVRKLREKIEVNPRNPRYLKVVWGIGYKIEK